MEPSSEVLRPLARNKLSGCFGDEICLDLRHSANTATTCWELIIKSIWVMLIIYYELTILECLLRNHIRSIQSKLDEILLDLLSLGAPDQELRQRYSRSFLEVLPDEFNNLTI